MNSIDVAWPFVPLVKYEPKWARSIGRWMLNVANNCRLFFPDQLPDENQCLPGMQDYTNSIIAYEGLRYEDQIFEPEKHKGIHPMALGDGPLWNENNPMESMFSVYSTSAVGILGAIVETTDVEGILRLNCNATDFYASKPYPVYLLYNPYDKVKKVTYAVEDGPKDLFDIVSRRYVARSVRKSAKVAIEPDSSAVIVELPAGSVITAEENGNLSVNNNVIAYNEKAN